MPLNFTKHAEKGTRFLKELAVELGNDRDTAHAGRILQAVIATLRERLTLEENFQLMAQLPIALKGLYVNGWKPFHEKEHGKNKEDFITAVIAKEGDKAWRDFSSIQDGERAVHAFFRTLRKFVSEGEMKDIEAVLPARMKSLVSSSI